jgi:hypothetical protein
MRGVFTIIFGLVLIFGSLIIDAPTMLILLLAYLAGFIITRLLNFTQKNTLNIYSILFLVSSIYMIICHMFMTYKGFEYMFATDIAGYFYPKNIEYLELGNYREILSQIWGDYQFLDRKIVGYFTYTTLWGVISRSLNANLFVTLQISTLFLYSFIGVVLYRIFLKCNFSTSHSFKYSLVISFFSIAFFWSSVFIRDTHVTLLYLLGIYLTFNLEFSVKTLVKLLIIIFITCTFRIESGLFLFILIPTYQLLSLTKSKYKLIVIGISSVFLVIIGSFVLYNITTIELIINANKENYALEYTGGIISTLQTIPILGDFLSIIYTALQPIPLWNALDPTGKPISLGEETYNILGFPQSINAFFNWFVIFYIMIWVFSSKVKKRIKGYIPKPLIYNLWIGLFFLLYQSHVVEQRRLIPYYCMFYILFFIIYEHISLSEKKLINETTIISFVILQITGVLYLMEL